MRATPRRQAPGVKNGRVQKKNNWDVSPDYYSHELRELVIDRQRPGAGYRHVLMQRDVERFIQILPDYLKVREGSEVRTTGRLLEVPVGPELVGRVVNPLGVPIDGKGPIGTTRTRLVESPAPGIVDRQPVKVPLQTGIKAIDAMTPIGRGQRELIIGDRKTGKTQIALDTILNQRESGVICVYIACGQMEAKVAAVVEKLKSTGAMDYTIVVVASSAESAPMQYIAPYAGTAIAEYFMYEEGKGHALRLRRPVEAGRGVSPVVAVGPPASGPRGVSGRRVLLPQPVARNAPPSSPRSM